MTEFGKYLTQCPHALNSKTGTLGLLKDALQNDMPKFRVLQAAYALGILDALRKSNPLTAEDRMRILTGLSSQYAMTDSAAQKAVAYWQESITPDILKNAEKEQVSCPPSENPATSPASFASPQRQGINIPANRPTIISISQDTIRLGLRIQWKRQPGLRGYEVWRAKENDPPILVKSGSFPIPRYQDFDVAEGCLYTYAVRGILSGEDKTVAACRCAKSGGLFGVRFEKRNNTWVYNWAFKLSEATAQHEGYDSIEICGRVTLDPDYPGCPYCETKSLFCFQIFHFIPIIIRRISTMSIIIGIDHGYYAIKTAHCSFPAGLTSYGEHEPYTRQGLLEFGGCFFVCGTGRQPIQRDKTINDNY